MAASASASSSATALPITSPPPLSKRSSSKHALRYASPPSTPPNKPRRVVGKGKEPVRGRHHQRPSTPPPPIPGQLQQAPRQDRDRDGYPNTGRPSRRDPRHSHGLSWSSTTRDSLVDNLLLSLDGLSFDENNFSAEDLERESDWSRQAALTAMNDTVSRARGHTYSSSASDHDRHTFYDSPTSNLSSPTYKSRRSASSSNFSHPYAVGGRVRPPKYGVEDRVDKKADTYAKSQSQSNGIPTHQRGYSDASSTDLGYAAALEASKLALGGVRSMSLDHIQQSHSNDSVLSRGRPVPSVHSKYDNAFDAAPEPMIPAGPRRMQNPTATGPVYVNAAPKQSTLRKTTTQTDLRAASTPLIPPEIREKASDFVRASSMRDSTSRPPIAEKAPPVPATSRKDAVSPQRERPGFFKRVFGGGSRGNDRTDTSHTSQQPNSASSNSQVRTGSRQGSSGQNTIPQPPPAQLNKKPSSFFRRRKKSTSDATKLPPPPLKLAPGKQPPGQPSPGISSLRKVMDPYLQDEAALGVRNPKQPEFSRPTTRHSALDDSDSLEIFHSGYTPPPDASLGRRNPISREPSRRPGQDSESPKLKVKIRKRAGDDPPSTAGSRPSDTSLVRELSKERRELPLTISDLEEDNAPPVSPISQKSPSVKGNERRVSSIGEEVEQFYAAQETASPVLQDDEMREFTAGNNIDANLQSDGWLMSLAKISIETPSSKRSQRLVLKPTASEERLSGKKILPTKDANLASPTFPSPGLRNMSNGSHQSYATPKERLPSTTSLSQPPTTDTDTSKPSPNASSVQVNSAHVDENTEYKDRARRIYEGDEEDVTKMEAASWLGETKTLNSRTLNEYMRLFDFSQTNVLQALRNLCGKLILRGETQQFDRIITAMSSRWCECNPNNGFKAQDVVHTICYSLILLNTDLHLADIGEKMSRNAYVKNTLPTIRRVVADAAPNAFDDTVRATTKDQSRPSLPWVDTKDSNPSSPSFPPDTPQERTSFDSGRPQGSKRLSIRPGAFRSESDSWLSDSAGNNGSNVLVNNTWTGSMRAWEYELEAVLKTFYASIRSEPLPLLSMTVTDQAPGERNLSVNNLGLKRSGSVVSKAASDAISSRSKPGFRNLTLGWQNRNTRARPKFYATNTMTSSRTSFDDSNSVWSPAQSSTWSKNSMGKTLTSTSMNSLGQQFSAGDRDYKHSIGFANALSHAIIREEGGGIVNPDSDAFTIKGDVLEDESLALEGAPWAKEGMVKHKHHLEGPERKAKERSWNECFAVISRGKLTLFNFNTDTKSRSLGRPRTKQGSRAPSIAGTRVGGGDWMENAEQLAVFILRHTISSTLPSPGYSKARPYVFALSLPSGAVHLFQVGTPEIAGEWMSSANYWSARLSKEPLSGGVSNIEYGWSEAVINPALLENKPSFSSPPPSIMNRQQGHMHSSSNATGPRPSIHSSLRGSLDIGGNSSKQRLPGDKVPITDWSPPSQSIMASQLVEVDQLKALVTYVANVEEELEKHNELKNAIEVVFSPRHTNLGKVMSNWQRKSEYLLREVVKFRTYIDSLTAAQKAKEVVYARRAERIQSNRSAAANIAADDTRHASANTKDTSMDVLPNASDVPS